MRRSSYAGGFQVPDFDRICASVQCETLHRARPERDRLIAHVCRVDSAELASLLGKGDEFAVLA